MLRRVFLEFDVHVGINPIGEFVTRWCSEGQTIFAGAGYTLPSAMQAIAREAVTHFVREAQGHNYMHPTVMISEAVLTALEAPI